MCCNVFWPAVDDSKEYRAGDRSLYVPRQELILIAVWKGLTMDPSAHQAQHGGPYDRPQFGTDTEI